MIVLSATSGGVSIASFASTIGASVGIASASFSFVFSLATVIIKKFLKTTRNNKKHNNIMLARSKLNSIETSISQALIDSNTSHKEYIKIINEEEKYRRMKEDVRMKKDELNKESKKNQIR